MLRQVFFFSLCCFILPLSVEAQTPQTLSEPMRFFLNEKIKDKSIREQLGLPNYEADSFETGHASDSRNGAEILVSDSPNEESEVDAIINPMDTSNLVCASIKNGATFGFMVRYSKDFGATWANSSINLNPFGLGNILGGGDPVLAAGSDGTIYLTWLSVGGSGMNLVSELYLASSTDGGATFQSFDTKIASGSLFGAGGTNDKQWMVMDNTSSPHSGNLYITSTLIDQSNPSPFIEFVRLEKGATTFSSPINVANGFQFAQFSTVKVDNEGDIHISFIGTKSNQVGMYHVVSTDGGLTFSAPIKAGSMLFPGLGGIGTQTKLLEGFQSQRLYPCPSMAINPKNNTIALVWSSYGTSSFNATAGYDVYYCTSSDKGQTWSSPKTINQGTNLEADQFYASSTYSPSGVLCVGYYDRTDDPAGPNAQYVVALSYDDGETFSPSIQASTVSSNFTKIDDQNNGFGIGEYNQIVATEGYVFPFWADGRENNGNIDVYTSKIRIGEESVGVEEWGSLSADFIAMSPNPNTGRGFLTVTPDKKSQMKWSAFGMDGKLIKSSNSIELSAGQNYSEPIDLPKGVWSIRVDLGTSFKVIRVVVQ